MSYTPTNWKAGDIITSERLNKLENGVAGAGGGGVLVVNFVEDGETMRLDKTAGELWAAIESSSILLKDVFDGNYNYTALTTAALSDGTYGFTFSGDEYGAPSADSYPILGGR